MVDGGPVGAILLFFLLWLKLAWRIGFIDGGFKDSTMLLKRGRRFNA